jgi:hypothetical protein
MPPLPFRRLIVVAPAPNSTPTGRAASTLDASNLPRCPTTLLVPPPAIHLLLLPPNARRYPLLPHPVMPPSPFRRLIVVVPAPNSTPTGRAATTLDASNLPRCPITLVAPPPALHLLLLLPMARRYPLLPRPGMPPSPFWRLIVVVQASNPTRAGQAEAMVDASSHLVPLLAIDGPLWSLHLPLLEMGTDLSSDVLGVCCGMRTTSNTISSFPHTIAALLHRHRLPRTTCSCSTHLPKPLHRFPLL